MQSRKANIIKVLNYLYKTKAITYNYLPKFLFVVGDLKHFIESIRKVEELNTVN